MSATFGAALAAGPLDSQRPKAIVVFSDGTGNSAAKLNKTNVWRLYQALDPTPPSAEQAASGELLQIALYDDGVGTSGFRPLALLGGVFGYGLKRNVLDLYKFLCRNYRPGDRIYAFGFSRGAFTVRILIGFILQVGLVQYQGKRHLQRHAQQAYRSYRRRFTASNLAGLIRKVRDGAINVWRALRGSPALPAMVAVHEVEFVGVWDTVAAYGTPLAEMTRAVDRWIWPLSMPNYVLSHRVKQARHALALDDERDTFHPLLWDEVAEAHALAQHRVAPRRLQQVWFAGMHSDVGGGYPDDGLAYVALEWMMGEAAAAGLRFKQSAVAAVAKEKNALGPMHDSRSGLGSYYRYQPRNLSARLEPPGASTLLMQDPNRDEAHGRLLDVVVHPSVLDRIRNGPDGYAPITLPKTFSVQMGSGGSSPHALAAGVERVWNDVWRRRITYFVALGVTLLFVLLPGLLPESDCHGPQCLVSPAILAVGAFLPDFLQPWVKAWAGNPTAFLVLVAALAATLAASKALQRSIDDKMSEVWRRTLTGAPGEPPSLRGVEAGILRLRTSLLYQKAIQRLKWRVAPALFAAVFLAVGSIAAVVLVHRIPWAFIDVHAKYCAAPAAEPTAVTAAPVAAAALFNTADPCWPSGLLVDQGVEYRLTLGVGQAWRDAHIATDPEGFDSAKFGLWAPVAAALRRSTSGRWFQPVVTLRDADGRTHTFAVTTKSEQPAPPASGGHQYSGTFKAPASGHVYLFVNDVLLPWGPAAAPRFYDNNAGTATVTLQRLPHVGNER